MASKNNVTLTFAGDSEKLEKAFGSVGTGADKLSGSFDRASKASEEHGNKLGALGEKADNSERSLIGVHDVIDGTATIMQGPGKQGLVSYIQGWADLAGGLAPLLLQMAEMNVKMLLAKGATIAHAAATGIATAAQWAWNVALTANPIGLIIAAIVLLIGAIVLIATKTTWFQTVWRVAWDGIKTAALAVADAVKGAFKAAFNFVADVWNNTIGRLSWSVPGWVPFIGGNTIAVPKLPHFHSGGVVPGPPTSEMLAVLQGGERVIANGSSGGGDVTVRFAGNTDTAFATAFQNLVRGGVIVLQAA
jgi:hypothetical protein